MEQGGRTDKLGRVSGDALGVQVVNERTDVGGGAARVGAEGGSEGSQSDTRVGAAEDGECETETLCGVAWSPRQRRWNGEGANGSRRVVTEAGRRREGRRQKGSVVELGRE